MIENVLKLVVKVADKECHMLFPNGMTFEALEQMCLQFIQRLGEIKAKQLADMEAQKEQEPKAE